MAANTPTINFLQNVFQLFWANHKFLNGYDFGGPDWNLDVVKDTQFPYMYVETGSSRWVNSYDSQAFLTEEQTFKIYVIDRITKGDANYIEVLSDCKYTIETYLSEINQHPYLRDLGIIFTDEVRFDPLYEFSKDNCNGWLAEFSLRYPMRFSPCNNPYIPIAGWTYSLNNYTSEVRLIGAPGATGPTGPAGTSGTSGVNATNGTSGTSGAAGATGAGGALGYFGSFYSSLNQTNPTASLTNLMTCNFTAENNGITVVNGTRFTSQYGGTYNVQFSAQFENLANNTAEYDIWLRKGSPTTVSSNVNFSNTRETIYKNPGQPGYQVPAWNWVITLQPQEFVEIAWSSASTSLQISAFSSTGSPTRPGIPSVIVTMTQVMFMQLSTSGSSGTSANGTAGTSGTSGLIGPQGPYCQAVQLVNIPGNPTVVYYYTDCDGIPQSGSISEDSIIDLCILSSDGITLDPDGYVQVFDNGICHGTSGTDGLNGSSGTAGTSGVTGTSGTSANGTAGTSGVTGTSGTSGTRGTSGTSGAFGTSGTSGTRGTSGTSGNTGTSGTSANATAGTSGTTPPNFTSGTSGTRGTSGVNGLTGTSGTSGAGGGGSAASFTYSNTCFVHPNGNDATGKVGRFDLPFATIEGAFYGTNGLGATYATPANGVIEVWPGVVGTENTYDGDTAVPSTGWDYFPQLNLDITFNFKLHLKAGVHIKWNAPNYGYTNGYGPFLNVLGDFDKTKAIRVEITAEDQTSSIEQSVNEGTDTINWEQYLCKASAFCNVSFENISLYSEPISWINSVFSDAMCGILSNGDAQFQFDRVIFKTTNKPQLMLGGDFITTHWRLSNLEIGYFCRAEIRRSTFMLNNWNNRDGITAAVDSWSNISVANNVDYDFVSLSLENSEFKNFWYWDGSTNTEDLCNAIRLKNNSGDNSVVYMQITDCQFSNSQDFTVLGGYDAWAVDLYAPAGTNQTMIFNDYGILNVSLVSRSVHNYDISGGLEPFKNRSGKTINFTTGDWSANLLDYFPNLITRRSNIW